ncbi:MAG: hypothetical protein A3H71_00290 [Candidatus Sungbacteria bacterium RIFCSPLOWO2_02_FULL_48_13b]|uniref:Vitamin K epoxide reductase domain-containing protein n=2 Tax=Candidatus Sungiibacteriota TaxID=1817917 RepID=A0A1G2LIU7_9BACT|nr:MAG: hypothetical protein A3C12_01055 [Candidatus Sungbacteria bacterium RIFCSPHIGHO2_02_FULL_49_20]OHA11444.1 MAG: hypothetical protein A3H71_00290 [Candidatus Sungbacteria bacterium RIFCSPLOWO2_02_FULL_48_13b]
MTPEVVPAPTLDRNSPRVLIGFLIAVAIAGFLNALYLAVKFLQGVTPPCSLLKGCDVVTASKYAEIGGIPIALIGAIFYAIVLGLLLAILHKPEEKRLVAIFAILTGAAFLISLGLVYIQLFVLRAICLYCMFSALDSTILFIGGLWLRRQSRGA